MIELIPAIDIMDGKCVRLTKGDYNSRTVYSEDPVYMAKCFEENGCNRLHVVDLDGAKAKHIVNIKVLKEITENTGLIVDFGGGIKADDDIRRAFDNGASMVTIGSIAATHREIFGSWISEYGADKIILGADVRDGKISINGWKEDTTIELFSFLDYYTGLGIGNVLCTDISKDGTLKGPAISLYKDIMQRYPHLHLIASGGVSCIEDIKELDKENIPAVVFGKSFYEGRIKLTDLWDLQKG